MYVTEQFREAYLIACSVREKTSQENSDKQRHARIRKAMNSTFRPNTLKEFEPTVSHYIDRFIDALTILSKREGGVVNMDEWFFNLMLSVRF